MHFSRNYEIAIFFRKANSTTKKWCVVGWWESAPLEKRLSEKPPIGAENFSYLQKAWEQEKMQSFKDIFRCYNNKVFDPSLDAMQKKVHFYHNKGFYMLKLGCTLPNLAKICLHSSTSAKF